MLAAARRVLFTPARGRAVTVSEVSIIHQQRQHRFELFVDDEFAGFAEYHNAPGEVRAFTHTVVFDEFQGRGLANRLAAAALDSTRDSGLGVLPHCPMIRGFIAKRSEYLDLVPEARREEFGLGAQ
nr:GNAT family N-acetyltransferase [Sediminivirga luteola]